MKITHEFLEKFIDEIDRKDNGYPDPHITGFSETKNQNSLKPELKADEIQTRLDAFLKALRESGYPDKSISTGQLLSRIARKAVGHYDDGRPYEYTLPTSIHELWWSFLAGQVNLLFFRDINLSPIPSVKKIAKSLFIESPGWGLTSSLRLTLAARARRALKSMAIGFEGLPPKQIDLSRYMEQAGFTDKERETYSLYKEYGLRITEVARRLGVHHSTVQCSIKAAEDKIYRKGKFK